MSQSKVQKHGHIDTTKIIIEATNKALKAADAAETSAVASADSASASALAVTEAITAKEAAEAAVANAPNIGVNGNWYIAGKDTGNPSRGEKGDTGIPGAPGPRGAKGNDGERGQAGYTPYIGANGNWWVNNTDTGNPSVPADVVSQSEFDSAITNVTVNDATTTVAGKVKIAAGGSGNTVYTNVQTDAAISTGLSGKLTNVAVGTGSSTGLVITSTNQTATITIQDANTARYGLTKLSNDINSTSEVLAATPYAVKAAYDRGSQGITTASMAQATAESKLSSIGVKNSNSGPGTLFESKELDFPSSDTVFVTLTQPFSDLTQVSIDLNIPGTKVALGLGSAAYLNVGTSAGNVVVLDSNGKIPDTVIGDIALYNSWTVTTAATKADVVTYINGITTAPTPKQGDMIFVVGGAAMGTYWLTTTKTAGTYTADDIADVKTPQNVVTSVSYLGTAYTATNGLVMLPATVPWAKLANVPVASTTASGIVQLNNTVTSTSTAQAATAAVLKTVNDIAVAANTLASTATQKNVANIWTAKQDFTAAGITVPTAPVGTNDAVSKSYVDDNIRQLHIMTHRIILNMLTANIVDGSNLFYHAYGIVTFDDVSFPKLKIANYMFSRVSTIVKCLIGAPVLETAKCMFLGMNSLKECTIMHAKIIDGESMFESCPVLNKISINTTMLAIGIKMFYNCTSLVTGPTSLPSLTNGGYMFLRCKVLVTGPTSLPVLVDGNNMFFGCEALVTVADSLPVLVDGRNMFSTCISLAIGPTSLPVLTNGASMFLGCKVLVTIASSLPVLTNGYSMFGDCASLVVGPTSIPLLTQGNYMFNGCTSLTTVAAAYPALTRGKDMFKNCKLTKETIDAILTSLPNRAGLVNSSSTGDGYITFTGCPGAATCNVSIATAKNWVVEI